MAKMRQITRYTEMQCEYFQPWSTFVMVTKLSPPIIEKMIKITDEILTPDSKMNWYGQRIEPEESGGGTQMKDEFHIDLKILEQEEIMGFFLGVTRQYVIQQWLQQNPLIKEEILSKEWNTKLLSMWMVSQKDNEYNPIHTHEHCHLSTVMYLKIPEYLPSRKTNRNEDGCIVFTNNVARDVFWGVPTITLKPQVGDFFIFPASQQHFVYPFRSPDGKGERRSVSFNAGFSTKTEQELILYKS